MNKVFVLMPFAIAAGVLRKSPRPRFLCVFAVLLLIGLPTARLNAQATASIVGTVQDPSGAVVPDVSVTARNQETGFIRQAMSNSQGLYQIGSLQVGTYTVTASRKGFKQNVVTNITLQVAQEARVDVALAAGDVAETVTVTDTSTLIQTEDSALGQVITNKQIVDLPLNGRHVTQLASLTPGAMRSGYNGGPAAATNTGFTTVSVSGGQSSKTEFIVDGITDTEQLYNGIQFEPSADFINEFRVISNGASAEYGRGSAVILMATKSGTNQIHGTVFEFIRLDTPGFQPDARNYFAAANTKVASQRQNQFGASFGGPIFKNRLFYFLNYDGTRRQVPTTQNSIVPSPALRSATNPDLSTLQGTNTYSTLACSTNSSTCLHDPYTGTAFPINASGHYYIPTNELDPTVSQYFLNPSYIPLPNQPDGVHFIYSPADTTNVDQGNVRIDYQISPKDSIFGRYSINDSYQYINGALPATGGTTNTINTKNIAFSYLHTFSPNLLNALHVGIGRLYYANSPQGNGTNHTTQSGLLGFNQTTLQYPGFPSVSFSNYAGINGVPFSPLINPTQTYEVSDLVTLNKGRHIFTFGVDARRFHLSSTNSAFSRGSLSFSCNYSGNGFVDFLMGNPCSGSRDFPRSVFGEKDFSIPMFVQDNWKLSKNLTLNLGLRYDLAMAPVQDLGQNSYFDIKTGKYIVSVYKNGQPNLGTQQVAQVAYNAYSSSIITASQAGLSNNLQTMSKKTFAPRVGFAYKPFGSTKTVLRGAYGIFYDLMYGNSTVSQAIINIPFILDASQSGATCITTNPCTIPTSSPNSENFFNYAYGVKGLGAPLLSAKDLNIRPPYNQEWNLAVQTELARDMSLQISYVGNKGTHLEKVLPLNYAVFGTTPLQTRRPQPLYGDGSNYTNLGNSIYHSLQATLEKRYSSGLYLLSAFTWSKLITDSNIDDGATIQNPSNLRMDRGLGSGNLPLRSVTSVIYALPFGRGMKFGSTMPRALDYVVGGWRVSAIAQMQSGLPFTVTENTDPLNNGGVYGTRPFRVGSGKLANPTINKWFDYSSASFTVNPTASGIYGNSGRNILMGPGSDNWDTTLMKDFHYSERVYAEFRVDAFNVFNHPQFGRPNSNIQSSAVGTITNTATPTNARQLQCAVKIYF